MRTFSLRAAALTAMATLPAETALAHAGVSAGSGLAAGLMHPMGGLDHLLAMLAVGLWSGQRGGRAVWALPLTFVGVMALGGLAGMAGLPLPLVEGGIALSVLALGLLAAALPALPGAAALGLVGAFALLHGHAHGTELAAGLSASSYAAGFLASTALLHVAGLGLVGLARLVELPRITRAAGAAIALGGVVLLTGVL